jgi:hypothetical protein
MIRQLNEPERAKSPSKPQGGARPKFKIRQLVYYRRKASKRFLRESPPWPYEITRLLPPTEDGEFQYEIRSTLEAHDRVARESELACS